MKKIETQLKKTPNILEFSETDFEDTEGLDTDQDILRDMNIFRKTFSGAPFKKDSMKTTMKNKKLTGKWNPSPKQIPWSNKLDKPRNI